MVMGRRTQFLAFAILLGAASAQAGELPVSPTIRDGEAGQQNDNTISWHQLLQGPNSTLSGSLGADNTFKNFRELSPPDATLGEQPQRGGTYLKLRTKKTLKTFEPLRRSGCETDEECADYSGLPKSEPPKGLKTPFLGLSITKPLQ